MVMVMNLLQSHQSLHQNAAPLLASNSFLYNNRIIISTSSFHDSSRRRKINSPLPVRAAEENDTEFELDRIKKAREALRQLDFQLHSLSNKQTTSPPKTRLSSPILDLNAGRGRDLMKEELPEFSGSYLAYSAFALLFFSIFYNVIFITVIKPSIDCPEPKLAPVPTVFTAKREAPNAGVVMESPPVAGQE